MLRHSLTLGMFALCTVIAASADEPTPLLPSDGPAEKVIDHYVAALLQADKITPAQLADDATLIRRLTLDLLGRIPTSAETDAYVSSTDPEKKVKLFDRLLASPEFVRHQATELNTLLQAEEAGRKGARKTALREFLVDSLAKNKGWDQIFRDVLLPDDAN